MRKTLRSALFPLGWSILCFAFACSPTDSSNGDTAAVAAPVFSPAAGTYTTAIAAAISTETAGASIRYTTDGTAPSSTVGSVYSSPIAVSATATIKAIAYQSGWTDSAVTEAAYTIDLPPGSTWTSATTAAAFPARTQHACVVFDNRIYAIAGRTNTASDDNQDLNDVWSSVDGASWTCATAAAAFPVRSSQSCVVYDGKIWVIAGADGNDVWSSVDGASWTCVTSNAAFAGRWGCTSVVFDNRMWVIGGNGANAFFNDAWYSSDGANWTCATSDAAFSKRSQHTSVVFDNRMWVIGGWNSVVADTLKNDVWYSSDGATWTCATGSAAFSARSGHSSVVFDGGMWVIGGGGSVGKEAWRSADGSNWTRVTDDAAFTPRAFHASVAFDGSLWVIGGSGGSAPLKDVWRSR